MANAMDDISPLPKRCRCSSKVSRSERSHGNAVNWELACAFLSRDISSVSLGRVRVLGLKRHSYSTYVVMTKWQLAESAASYRHGDRRIFHTAQVSTTLLVTKRVGSIAITEERPVQRCNLRKVHRIGQHCLSEFSAADQPSIMGLKAKAGVGIRQPSLE